MLEMTGVSKAYRCNGLEIFALRDFSLKVKEGEFIAVTGPSGCGKTTFLAIAGLLEGVTHGEYKLDGVNVRRMTDQERSHLRNERIGFVFQSFNLIADLSVYENVEMPLRYRGLTVADRDRRTTDSLSRVGLSRRAGHQPTELSAGQQQRVAIARALAGSPAVLLADEPTANLDTEMARGIMELFQELHQGGATIVTVTHDQELTARAEREIHIFDGNIVVHPLLQPCDQDCS